MRQLENTEGKRILAEKAVKYIERGHSVSVSYTHLEFKSGEITKEEYDMWRYSYPHIKAERIHEEFKKLKNNTLK